MVNEVVVPPRLCGVLEVGPRGLGLAGELGHDAVDRLVICEELPEAPRPLHIQRDVDARAKSYR